MLLDSSALYAVFDRDDENHEAAGRSWEALLSADTRLITHNYIVLELTALLQHRLKMDAVRDLGVEILPVCVEMMRCNGCDRAFAFDPHFDQQGFQTQWPP